MHEYLSKISHTPPLLPFFNFWEGYGRVEGRRKISNTLEVLIRICENVVFTTLKAFQSGSKLSERSP